MRRMNQEHIVGIVCIAVAAVTIALASTFPKGQAAVSVSGPALFPNVLAALLAVLGVVEIVIGFAKAGAFSSISIRDLLANLRRPEVRNSLIVIAAMILYIALFRVLGFFVTTFLFVGCMMWTLGVPWLRNLVYSAVFLVVIYLVFGVLFTISLPAGVLSVFGL